MNYSKEQFDVGQQIYENTKGRWATLRELEQCLFHFNRAYDFLPPDEKVEANSDYIFAVVRECLHYAQMCMISYMGELNEISQRSHWENLFKSSNKKQLFEKMERCIWLISKIVNDPKLRVLHKWVIVGIVLNKRRLKDASNAMAVYHAPSATLEELLNSEIFKELK